MRVFSRAICDFYTIIALLTRCDLLDLHFHRFIKVQDSQGQWRGSVTNSDNDKDIDYKETRRDVKCIVECKLCFRGIQQSSGGLRFAPPECCSDNGDRNTA